MLTQPFNVKRQRSGHLFHGRYKSILVQADEYAKELSRYIHLNPVRAAIVERPEEYEWSSYLYYAVRKKKPAWLSTDFILGYFGENHSVAQRRYKNYVSSLLGQEYENPLLDISAYAILGIPEFINEIKDKFLSNKKLDRNLPAFKDLTSRPSMDAISKAVDSIVVKNDKLARKMKLYLCHRYSGIKLNEIGACFDIGESGVSQTSRRFSEHLKNDKKVRKATAIVKKKLDI